MKFFAPLVTAAVLLIVSVPAHAVMSPDTVVNGVNSTFRSNFLSGSGAKPNGLSGGGSSGGTGITNICNGSPENATVLLALLSGAGLLAGRRMRKVRVANPAVAELV